MFSDKDEAAKLGEDIQSTLNGPPSMRFNIELLRVDLASRKLTTCVDIVRFDPSSDTS